MARLHWAILCERAVIDTQTNNASLFHIIEQLVFPPDLVPARGERIATTLTLAVLWGRNDLDAPEDCDARILLRGPAGKQIVEPVEIHVLLDEYQRSRSFIRLDTFPYDGIGQYEFVVQEKGPKRWKTLARVPLLVTFADRVNVIDETG